MFIPYMYHWYCLVNWDTFHHVSVDIFIVDASLHRVHTHNLIKTPVD